MARGRATKRKRNKCIIVKRTSYYKKYFNYEFTDIQFFKEARTSLEKLKAGGLAKDIVEILITEGPLNVSQLTSKLKEVRGKASRKTVSAKLIELLSLGLVETVEGKKSEKLYRVKDSE